MPDSPPDVSPTGKPILPPALVPWAWGIYVVVAAVLAFLAKDAGPLEPYRWHLTLAGVVLGSLLGAASPGLRQAPPTLAWLLLAALLALPAPARASPPRCTIWAYLGGQCAQPPGQIQARALDAGPLSLPWAVQAFGGASVDLGGPSRGAIRPLTGVGAGLRVLDFGGRGLDVLAVGGTTGTEGGLLGGGACFQVTPGSYDYVAEACAAVLFPVLAGQPEPPRAALLFAVGPKF